MDDDRDIPDIEEGTNMIYIHKKAKKALEKLDNPKLKETDIFEGFPADKKTKKKKKR